MNIFNDTYLASDGRSRDTRDSGSWLSLLPVRLHRVGAWWSERRTRNREMRELYRFSDRELWDVGLSRSDIMSIENGSYKRD